MNPQRWDEVKRVFTAALEQPDSERSRFVVDACQGDHQLAAEVRELLAADGEADSFLSTIALHHGDAVSLDSSHDSIQVLPEGSIISARFQIRRLLGTGGMGHVYEAVDLELGIAVALKAIRPDIASDQRALARFKKEVQLTRRIAHPNVCRVFDIGRHVHRPDDALAIQQDFTYLTMELLDGPTLSAVLREKARFSPAEALPIAEQIAAALAAAHSLGIVHRDIKPSNIMLVGNAPETRVVVTDFGLARLVSAEDDAEGSRFSLTERGKAIGTFAYMAPEQLVGASITPQTDIYAFGLLLYEMLTGVRAWGSQALSSVVERLKNPPANPSTHLAALDPQWERAILGCVQVDPAARFQTAHEVAEAIEGAAPRLADHRKLKPGQITTELARRRPTLRKVLALLATLVIVVALSVGAFRYYKMKGTSAITPGESVLLTEIINSTGDKRFDNSTALLRNQLSQSPYFKLVDPQRIRSVLEQMTAATNSVLDSRRAREVALRTGSPRVIFGTVSLTGDTYNLNVEVEEPDNEPDRARSRWERQWSWRNPEHLSATEISPGFLDAVRDSAAWIRREIGESANDIARLDAPPQDVTTNNWDALSEFAAAESSKATQDTQAAITHLHNAVQADPRFALGYMRMGDILVSLRRFDEGYRAYAKALADEQERRLTRRERDRLTGIFAIDTQNYKVALAAFDDYVAVYRDDYLGWFYRAYPLMKLGRIDEALATLSRAVAIDRSRSSALTHLARFNLLSSNFAEASQWLQRLRDAGHSDDAVLIDGELQFLEGNYGASRQRFVQLFSSTDVYFQSWGYSLEARILAELGSYRAALEALDKGRRFDIANGNDPDAADKLLDRAYVEFKSGRYDDCLSDVRSALALDHSLSRSVIAATLLSRSASNVKGRSRSAMLNELVRINNQLSTSDFGPASAIAHARVRGEFFWAKQEWRLALLQFRQAEQLSAPMDDREYLARGLLSAAAHDRDPARAAKEQKEALDYYGFIAERPAVVWEWARSYPPGYWSDQVLSYACLSHDMGMNRHKVDALLNAYLARRSHADSDLSDVNAAVRLLGGSKTTTSPQFSKGE